MPAHPRPSRPSAGVPASPPRVAPAPAGPVGAGRRRPGSWRPSTSSRRPPAPGGPGPISPNGHPAVAANGAVAPAGRADPATATSAPAGPSDAEDADLAVQLVHLTIETSQGDLDLSVPDSATPAALLSIVLALAPAALRDQSVGRGGWLVSRRGGGPLPGGKTLAELGVIEGEVLRLSGASDAAPKPTFDDLADAVADAAGNQPHRWTLAASRRTAEVFGGAFAALGLLAVSLLGPPWNHVPLIAGVLSVVLLAAATLTSRGIGQIARRRTAGSGRRGRGRNLRCHRHRR